MAFSLMFLIKENHLYNYVVTADYYEHLLGVKIERSGKDIGRLCFVSFDSDIYINLNYEDAALVIFDEADVINDECDQRGNAAEKRDALPMCCVFYLLKRECSESWALTGKGIAITSYSLCHASAKKGMSALKILKCIAQTISGTCLSTS
jgi:hypothetical protein